MKVLPARKVILPDGTVLAMGTVADGDTLMRSGTELIGGGSGGGGAPSNATYVTLTTNATLTNERTLAVGTGLDLTDAGAGSTATISLDLSEVSSGGDLGGTMDAPTVTDLTITGETRGDLLTRGAASWERLAPGTSGYALTSAGAGSDLTWARYQPYDAGALTSITAGTWTGATSITTLGTIATGTWQGTAVGVAYGGTGFTSYTAGDYVAATASTTLSKVSAPTYPGSAAPAWTAAGVPTTRSFRPLSGMGGVVWEMVFTETTAVAVGATSLTASGSTSAHADAIGLAVRYTTGASAGNAAGWRISANLSGCESGGIQFFSVLLGSDVSDTRTWIGVVTGGSGFPNSATYNTVEHVAIYADPATNGGKWLVSHADGVTQDNATDTGVSYAADTEVCVMFVWAAGGASCDVYMGTTPRNMTLVKTVTTNMPDTTDSVRPDCRMIRTAIGGTKSIVCRGAAGVTPV